MAEWKAHRSRWQYGTLLNNINKVSEVLVTRLAISRVLQPIVHNAPESQFPHVFQRCWSFCDILPGTEMRVGGTLHRLKQRYSKERWLHQRGCENFDTCIHHRLVSDQMQIAKSPEKLRGRHPGIQKLSVAGLENIVSYSLLTIAVELGLCCRAPYRQTCFSQALEPGATACIRKLGNCPTNTPCHATPRCDVRSNSQAIEELSLAWKTSIPRRIYSCELHNFQISLVIVDTSTRVPPDWGKISRSANVSGVERSWKR